MLLMRLALVALLTTAAFAQGLDFSTIEKAALEEMRVESIPGAAIAVIQGDRVVFSKALGIANIETGELVTTEMLFRLGSTTKMFTAATVVSLAEEGRLALDAPVGKYISGLDPAISLLTAHQLLTHTSGLQDNAPWYGPQDEAALAGVIRSWKPSVLAREPGKLYAYSNPGYWMAGLLAEAVGGKPYADLVSSRIFGPLGMKRSTFRPTMAMTWPLAQGHEAKEGKITVVRPVANNAASWPAGSMYSSVEELSRWIIALMNDGKIDGQQVLSPKVIARLSTPQVDIPKSERKYGYGIQIGSLRGARMLAHNGSRLGHGSSIQMLPERRVGVVVVTNRTGGNLPKTVEQVLTMMAP
jgi:CubicO group peptidase (beta-lactamase class C family)